MSVNLQKGQKVNLKKSDGGRLKRVIVGLGWDEAEQKSGGLFSSLFGSGNRNADIDCDASAILCVDGKLTDKDDVVFFGNLKHKSGAVKHMGDNLTGAGEGDDEQIVVQLDLLPSHYDKIIFVVNIYEADKRKQDFGMIKNAFIRIIDADNGQELMKYNLSENYDGKTGMVFGEVYRHNGEWKFNAIGQGVNASYVFDLAERFI